MKLLRFFLIGILFGVVMTKSEAISWYRIQEMFRFESIHMYGIIGTAVLIGSLAIYFIKRNNWKSIEGEPMELHPKEPTFYRYLFGGTIFGFGWAMTGACPGPLYVLFGNGITVVIMALVGAVLGTLVYGAVRRYLPH